MAINNMESKKQLCKIPDFIEFEFYPEQQLHAFIEIENLTEQILSYRVKTTAPTEYLVKPMEGQIYKREKAKIVFKRKKLSHQNFEAIQNGSKPFKERFMFVVTCKSKNAIGIEKVDQETKIANVKFINPRKASVEPSPVKKIKKIKGGEPKKQQTEVVNQIALEKAKLQDLRKKRAAEEGKLQALVYAHQTGTSTQSMGSSSHIGSLTLNQQNIICLIILFLLLGLCL